MWPKSPTELAPEMKAPVLGLYGEADQGIPVAQVEAMKEALQAARKTAEFKIYPGAPHGFHADYRAELPQGGGRGRLEPDDRLVQEVQGARADRRAVRPQGAALGAAPFLSQASTVARARTRATCDPRLHFGICTSSLTCSAVNGAGMNFPATASAMIWSIPSTRRSPCFPSE